MVAKTTDMKRFQPPEQLAAVVLRAALRAVDGWKADQ